MNTPKEYTLRGRTKLDLRAEDIVAGDIIDLGFALSTPVSTSVRRTDGHNIWTQPYGSDAGIHFFAICSTATLFNVWRLSKTKVDLAVDIAVNALLGAGVTPRADTVEQLRTMYREILER